MSTKNSTETSHVINLYEIKRSIVKCLGRICCCITAIKARVRRRISHVPNLIQELNAYEVRRLTQIKLIRQCDFCRILDRACRRFHRSSTVVLFVELFITCAELNT